MKKTKQFKTMILKLIKKNIIYLYIIYYDGDAHRDRFGE